MTAPCRAAPVARVLLCGLVVLALGAGCSHTSTTAQKPTSATAPTLHDHWHVALGVDVCGKWVPYWAWPPGAVTASSSPGSGAPARAGSGGLIYAGLHSHDDGIIHIEPLARDETGSSATLGRYFKFGGWHLDATSITFVGVREHNGDLCHGQPGVLRWAVNGSEHHGNPAAYKLRDRDTIALVFTTRDAAMPPRIAVPSYGNLRAILGEAQLPGTHTGFGTGDATTLSLAPPTG